MSNNVARRSISLETLDARDIIGHGRRIRVISPYAQYKLYTQLSIRVSENVA